MLSKTAVAIALAFFWLAPPAHAGADPIAACKQRKAKATGQRTATLLKESGRHVLQPDAWRLFAARDKGLRRMSTSFSKAEGKGGCATTDADAFWADVELFVADVVAEIEPGRFVATGDGTITDLSSGLMWEQKDDNNTGGVHDVDNRYTWTDPGDGDGTNPDGTAFTFFLDTLNNKCDGDESAPCTEDADCTGIGNGLCGHAGYRDWRLPEINKSQGRGELDSLVYVAQPGPQTASVFKTPCTYACTSPGCSCTASWYWPYFSSSHWSSTTNAFSPGNAWVVNFSRGLSSSGGVYDTGKNYARHVRAVRGPD
jgi:hypothetical protein